MSAGEGAKEGNARVCSLLGGLFSGQVILVHGALCRLESKQHHF